MLFCLNLILIFYDHTNTKYIICIGMDKEQYMKYFIQNNLNKINQYDTIGEKKELILSHRFLYKICEWGKDGQV